LRLLVTRVGRELKRLSFVSMARRVVFVNEMMKVALPVKVVVVNVRMRVVSPDS
jgi:hypothetical protein